MGNTRLYFHMFPNLRGYWALIKGLHIYSYWAQIKGVTGPKLRGYWAKFNGSQ